MPTVRKLHAPWGPEGHRAVVDWPLLWASLLAIDAQLVAEEKVRRLEEKLQLENDLRLSMSHLASHLVSKIETKGTENKALVCDFLCLEGCEMWWSHIRIVIAQLDWDAKTWDQWETSDTENDMAVIIGDEEEPEALLLRQKSLMQQKGKSQQA